MEQERFTGGGPDPGMCGCDRDLFQRVWRRVMPEDREDSPIEVRNEQETSLAVPQNAAAASTLPHNNSAAEKNMAAEQTVACLGEGSAIYSELLQEFITHELTDWKCYRALARCAGPIAGRLLSGLAAEEYFHAKRLSAAYFLISGVRFWPEQLPSPGVRSFHGALRRRFFAELQGEADYQAAADETGDPCLHDLYIELAGQEAEHARLVRNILENIS